MDQQENKIKILHIAKPVGGVGTYIELLDKYICKDQFINYLAYNQNEDKLSGYLQEITSFNLNIVRSINPVKDFHSIIQLVKIIKNVGPDIIHCHSSKAGIIGRIAALITNTKSIYTPHSYYYIGQHGIKKNIFKSIERFFKYFSNSYILSCSESEKLRALNDIQINSKNIYLWENSIPLTNQNNEKENTLTEKYICSLARVSTQKNLLLALKAYKIIYETNPEIRYIIVGVGHYSDQLQKIQEYIKNNNLEKGVLLIDWMDRIETLKILNKCWIYLSTSYYEGLPYSMLEALSFGKPIIATDCDGNRDLVINNENGFLVSFDEFEIADKIRKIHNNTKLYNNFSLQSLIKSQQFDIVKNIKRLESIYTEIINR